MSFALPILAPDNEPAQKKLANAMEAEYDKELLLKLLLSLNAGNSGDVSDRVYYAKKQLAALKTAFNGIDEQYNPTE